MKFNFVAILIILGLVGIVAAQPAKAPVVFTEKDRESVLQYLDETKAEYVKQLSGISDAQLNFSAAEGRWTIAEIAEHIAVVEQALFGMFTAPTASKKFASDDLPRIADTTIKLAITNRGTKFTAPEQVRPNGRWKTVADLLANFEKTRATTIDFIKNNKTDLRATFVQSPMGTIDSAQGIVFISGHADRHLAQLREVKADAKYPK